MFTRFINSIDKKHSLDKKDKIIIFFIILSSFLLFYVFYLQDKSYKIEENIVSDILLQKAKEFTFGGCKYDGHYPRFHQCMHRFDDRIFIDDHDRHPIYFEDKSYVDYVIRNLLNKAIYLESFKNDVQLSTNTLPQQRNEK